MKHLLAVLILLALAVPSVAQTATDQPAYFIGANVGFSRAASVNPTLGIGFGMRAANTDGTWATLEFANATAVTSTIQVGLRQVLAKRGGWSLIALGSAGGAVTQSDDSGQGSAITAMFGGGGGLAYDLTRIWSKLDTLSLEAQVKAVKINGTDVQLGFAGWITKSF